VAWGKRKEAMKKKKRVERKQKEENGRICNGDYIRSVTLTVVAAWLSA
jgi:hypothetical protein